MSLNDIDVRALRRTMQAELERQKRRSRYGLFLGHFIITVMFAIIAWSVILSLTPAPPDDVFGMLIMLTVGSLVGLFFHGASIGMDGRFGQGQLRERAMARALDMEMQRLGIEDDEPVETKRKRLMTLSDDGELVETEAGVETADAQRQRNTL